MGRPDCVPCLADSYCPGQTTSRIRLLLRTQASSIIRYSTQARPGPDSASRCGILVCTSCACSSRLTSCHGESRLRREMAVPQWRQLTSVRRMFQEEQRSCHALRTRLPTDKAPRSHHLPVCLVFLHWLSVDILTQTMKSGLGAGVRLHVRGRLLRR